MERIQCYNADGDFLDSLVQYDQKQVVYIDNLENGAIPNVHFAFKGNEYSWEFTNIVSLSSNRIKINIPNALMQHNGLLYLFFYYGNGEEYTTRYYAIITIIEKPKPEDYVYDEDNSSASVSQLQSDINSLFSLVNNKVTSPTTGSVGQFLRVKTVDSAGKPASWETANIENIVNSYCKSYIESEILGGAS